MIKNYKTFFCENIEKILIFMLWAGACFQIVAMLVCSYNSSIWYDESASLLKMKFSYGGIWYLLANYDVHVPLYFFYLKTLMLGLSWLLPAVTIGKIASILPFVGLLVVSATLVRKGWGSFCGALFAFCITAMPYMFKQGIELRMYSLGLLLLTLCFIFAFKTAKEPKLSNFVWLTVFASLCTYTHYIICVSAVVVYALLCVWFLLNDKKSLLKWLLSGICVAVLYIPWLGNMLSTVDRTSDDFWITMNIKSIIGYAVYPFYISKENIAPILLIIVFALVGLFFIIAHRKERRLLTDFNKYFALSGVSVYFITMLIGVIVSLIMRPILVNRYLFPATGCLWLGFCIALSNWRPHFDKNRKLLTNHQTVAIVCFLGVIGLCTTAIYIKAEYNTYKNYTAVSEKVFSKIGDNDAIITDWWHGLSIAAYLTDAKTIYSYPSDRIDEFNKNLNNNIEALATVDELNSLIEKYDRIWLLLSNSQNSEEYVSSMRENGIAFESQGKMTFESYTFDVFMAYK